MVVRLTRLPLGARRLSGGVLLGSWRGIVAQMVGEEEECNCCLFWDDSVPEEAKKILAGSQSQPINHALNKGFRSSRGQEGGGPENSGPKIEVIRSGWERAQCHACSLSGRLFFPAVCSEVSAFFSSLA